MLLPDSLYICYLVCFTVFWNYKIGPHYWTCFLPCSDAIEGSPIFHFFWYSKNGPRLRIVDLSIISTVSLACSDIIDQVIKQFFYMGFGNSQTVVPQCRGLCFELLPSAYCRWQQFKTLSPPPRAWRANSLTVPKSHIMNNCILFYVASIYLVFLYITEFKYQWS